MTSLNNFGWTAELQAAWQNLQLDNAQPGRVIADYGTSAKVAMPQVLTAEIAARLAHHTTSDDIPKVGDWVGVTTTDSNATIIAVLPRRSELVRKVSGARSIKQVLATNVDLAFVLLALDDDFSVARLQRYLYQLSANSIKPIIVLNKADKTDDVKGYADQVRQLAVPVIVASALNGDGVKEIEAAIKPGQTAILLGSSGVGKSTLINRLLGAEVQATKSIRATDSTGRHTTVHRELFMLPNGGMLIDAPGIRELQLWGTHEDLESSFADIKALASQCDFSNCQHGSENGCAVRAAINAGQLTKSHYADYQKLKLEVEALGVKVAARKQIQNKKSYKSTKRRDDTELREMWQDLD